MKVTTTTTYGGRAANDDKGIGALDGVSITATAEVPEDLVALFVAEGLKSMIYRGGASTLNHGLGKDKNSQVEYSDAVAAKVKAMLETWFADGCPNKRGTETALPDGVDVEVSTARYTPGDGAGTSRKSATEMASKVHGTPMVVALGLAMDASMEDVIEACHAQFFAKKKAVKTS